MSSTPSLGTIGLDISALDPAFKAHAQRGIGRYVSELLRFFERRAGSSTEAELLRVATFDHRSLESEGSSLVKAASALVRCSPILRTTLKQQFLFPSQLAGAKGRLIGKDQSVGLDSVHFPAHMDAPAWGMRRYALTVLDLIPIVCADLYRAVHAGPRFRFARWLELSAIRNAAVVLCISANTARDVNQVLGVPWERLVVTPLGVNEKFFSVRRDDLSDELQGRLGMNDKFRGRPIVLYVGGIDPRKNISVLLQAFAETVAHFLGQTTSVAPVLIMAGRIQAEREYPELCALVRALRLEDHVVLPGYVPDDDLRALYGASSVFFFPSLYEGFGLPPLEAMAAGVPVVSSDSSAMPEVLGEAAMLFPPTEVSKAARSLIEVLSNRDLAQSLRVQGKDRARLFTWDKTGNATLHAYHKLLTGAAARVSGGKT